MLALPEQRRLRQSHRKSRFGCDQCKSRKTKCDEGQPVCLKCNRTGRECHYSNHPRDSSYDEPGSAPARSSNYPRGVRFATTSRWGTSAAPHSAGPGSVAHQMTHRPGAIEKSRGLLSKSRMPSGLLASDLEWWQHHLQQVPPFPERNSSSYVWRETLPMLAYQHRPLLHLLLGFAALSKARLDAQRRSEILQRGEHHFTVGLQALTKELRHFEHSSFEALYTSAALVCLYQLGQGPRPGQYLAFATHAENQYLIGNRGLQFLISYKQKVLGSSASTGWMEASEANMSFQADSFGRGAEFGQHFDYLERWIHASRGEVPIEVISVNLKALSDLRQDFEATYCQPNPPTGRWGRSGVVAFKWLFELSPEFLHHLQQHSPAALAIYACYAVLLKEVGSDWFIQGWPEHILDGAFTYIGSKNLALLEWPLDQFRSPPATAVAVSC